MLKLLDISRISMLEPGHNAAGKAWAISSANPLLSSANRILPN
jgi:hypothetical protein